MPEEPVLQGHQAGKQENQYPRKRIQPLYQVKKGTHTGAFFSSDSVRGTAAEYYPWVLRE